MSSPQPPRNSYIHSHLTGPVDTALHHFLYSLPLFLLLSPSTESQQAAIVLDVVDRNPLATRFPPPCQPRPFSVSGREQTLPYPHALTFIIPTPNIINVTKSNTTNTQGHSHYEPLPPYSFIGSAPPPCAASVFVSPPTARFHQRW